MSTGFQSTNAVKDSPSYSCVAKATHSTLSIVLPASQSKGTHSTNSLETCVHSRKLLARVIGELEHEFSKPHGLLVDTNVHFPKPNLVMVPQIFPQRTDFLLTPLYSFPNLVL